MSAIAEELETVRLTDKAARRVSRILSKEVPGTVLRISVAGAAVRASSTNTIWSRKSRARTTWFWSATARGC
jgi:Fe-S cluster assembly iron-binding protein IscA